MSTVDIMLGDFTDERNKKDRKASEDEFFGIAITLRGKLVLPISEEEADQLADTLRATVDAFRKFRREEIDPLRAQFRMEGAAKKQAVKS